MYRYKLPQLGQANKTKKGEDENSFYADLGNNGIMSQQGSIQAANETISQLEKKIKLIDHNQYLAMLNGDKEQMNTLDAEREATKQNLSTAITIRDNSLGLGQDGWASQSDNMLDAPPAVDPSVTSSAQDTGSVGSTVVTGIGAVLAGIDGYSGSVSGSTGAKGSPPRADGYGVEPTSGAVSPTWGLDDDEEEPPEPMPSPMPGPPPQLEDMESYNDELGEYYEAHDAWEDEKAKKSSDNAEENQAKYKTEKQQRADELQYIPTEDFSSIINDSLKYAQTNLEAARNTGDEKQIAKFEEEVRLFEAIEDMYTNVNNKNSFRYYQLESGLQLVQSLAEMYQEDKNESTTMMDFSVADRKYKIIKGEILAINSGMNVVGEAYLDELDQRRKDGKISPENYELAYRDYYASVIQRESAIEVESTSLNEDNLTMMNVSTSSDLSLLEILEGFDVPLYSTEQDAVLAFKKEAMPLTLETDKEHGAILDTIEILDTGTGENKTYYYYIDVKKGAENNVAFQAFLGGGGGKDRKLLHTHPVEGHLGRNFSGDPMDDGLFGEMGDSSVPGWLGYGGIYVVSSGAEVKY